MRRPLLAGLLLGLLNASVALVTLVVVRALTPDTVGWFAYAPLDDAQPDSRFPWAYVVVPLALLVADALAVPLLLRLGRTGLSDAGGTTPA